MQYPAVVCILLATLSATQTAGQEVLGRQAVVPVGKPTIADVTPEEAVVRMAYAKFAYAAEQEVIGRLAAEVDEAGPPAGHPRLDTDHRLDDARISFKLSDFVVGNLNDIINRRAADLISPPAGEILAATTSVQTFADGGANTSLEGLQPRWREANVTTPEALNATLGELHEREWRSQAPTTTWGRYASYSVTVTFQGKSRGPYKALFVFGHDAKGNVMVIPEDDTTDSLALAAVVSERLFPDPLVRSWLRGYPVVADWLAARQKFGGTCAPGQGDVCCDLILLECGPASEDVADGLAKPLPPGTPPQK